MRVALTNRFGTKPLRIGAAHVATRAAGPAIVEKSGGALMFRGKPSVPWTPESIHDFMHAKVTVADDVVFAGSFNLSRSGEMNAENVLEVHDPELADRMAAFVDEVRDRYGAMPAPRDAART